MRCGSYREVKLLGHAIKIVKRKLEKQTPTLINLNRMQFSLMPRKQTANATLIVRRMWEEYQMQEKKLYMLI